jgi:ribosomal protein L22
MSDEKNEKLEKEKERPDTEGLPEDQDVLEEEDEDTGDDGTSDETSDDTSDETSDDTGSDPDAATDDEPEAAKGSDPAKKRRRGSAETTTTAKRETVAAPRDAQGRVAVRAQARYVRCAPRKARLVVDHIRGKSVEDARAILATTPRAAARDVLKLLDSAIANAENNHELVADELRVGKAFVDEGPTLKRFRPRAQGRATRINKRTSHMTILLTTKEDG